MRAVDRGASEVTSVIMMVAIVVILAATASVFFFDVAEDINEPAPNVADTTGEFEAGSDRSQQQLVRITHLAGEGVNIEETEIIIRASGPDLDAEARLVDLPATERYISDNVEGNDLIDTDSARTPMQIIVDDDSNRWSAGDTIQFRISVTSADFTKDPTYDDADELEVIIIHTPSNAIISEHTFRP